MRSTIFVIRTRVAYSLRRALAEVGNMKLINVTKLGGSILGLLLLLGVGVMSSTTAQAQYPYPNQDQYRRDRDRNNDRYRNRDYDPYRDRDNDRYRNRDYDRDQDRYGQRGRGRNWDGYRNYGGSYELRQTALNAGYNEGVKAGRNDRRHNGSYDFSDNSAYQRATKDYNSRMGDRWIYQRYFRDAFENGYADGLRGY